MVCVYAMRLVSSHTLCRRWQRTTRSSLSSACGFGACRPSDWSSTRMCVFFFFFFVDYSLLMSCCRGVPYRCMHPIAGCYCLSPSRTLTPCQLFRSGDPFEPASRLLEELPLHLSPTDMLRCVERSVHCTVASAARVKGSLGQQVFFGPTHPACSTTMPISSSILILADVSRRPPADVHPRRHPCGRAVHASVHLLHGQLCFQPGKNDRVRLLPRHVTRYSNDKSAVVIFFFSSHWFPAAVAHILSVTPQQIQSISLAQIS